MSDRYAFLSRLHDLDPYEDINCKQLADYLAGGLNYAIAQYDLGDPIAQIISPIIPPLGDTIIYTLDTTDDLRVDRYYGFPSLGGYLQLLSIDSPTQATFRNVSVDPTSNLQLPTSLIAKIVAVRSTATYDSITADLSCYPMLKVHRLKERATDSGVVEVDLTIGYGMAFANVEKIPGMMHWVARHIDAMLSYLSQIDHSCPFQVLHETDKMSIEYRTLVDNLQNPVYMYLRINLMAREFN